MTEREQLIQDTKDYLSKIPSGPQFDLTAAVDKLALHYSFPANEICRLVIEQAKALGKNWIKFT